MPHRIHVLIVRSTITTIVTTLSITITEGVRETPYVTVITSTTTTVGAGAQVTAAATMRKRTANTDALVNYVRQAADGQTVSTMTDNNSFASACSCLHITPGSTTVTVTDPAIVSWSFINRVRTY